MAEKTLIASVQNRDDSEAIVVASPAVGIADGCPSAGLFLNPFDKILTIKIMNQRYQLRLPRDVHGRVTETFIPDSYTPVSYNQPIVTLDPRVLSSGSEFSADSVTGQEDVEAESAGMIEVKAPSEGIFYRRPSPDSSPYVEEGAMVTGGSVLGLVEVMKCFNQITYGGPGLPARGEVTRIMVEDSEEVQFGQVLCWIKPAE